MAPLRFIPAGNFSPIVSCPTWLHCVSYRQETIRVQFPIRHSSIAFHTDRKLFTNGFLFDMVPLRFIPTGNFLQMGPYPAWPHYVSYRQETFHKWVPIRHGSIAFHRGRKLFANGFLSDMVPLRFIAAGNFSRMVSCLAWRHCVSSRQETFRPEISRLRFAPLEMTERHGAAVSHRNRKLFAYSFPSGMAPLRFISTGNFSRIVSYPTWCHCVSS